MEINEWVVVDNHYTEAVFACRAMSDISGTIGKTKYGLTLTVADRSTQIGLDEQFTSNQWLQIPALASLMAHDVRFTNDKVWVGTTLVLQCKNPDNTEVGVLEVLDQTYKNTEDCVHDLSQTFQWLFNIMLRQRMGVGIPDDILNAVTAVLQYVDSDTPLTIAARQEFDRSIGVLASICAQYRHTILLEGLHALRLSDCNERNLTYRNLELNKSALVKELLMQLSMIGLE